MFQQSQEALREGRETLAAVKQDAEAIKRLPLIRGYVEDANAIIFRPDQSCDRRAYATDDLFEPNRSVLSESGKAHLNNLAPWLESNKASGTDMVVVSYADPASLDINGAAAQLLTQKQSEAVAAYLRDVLRAHRISWMSSRKITSLGMGTYPPPLPEKDILAPGRTEILVFSPR
jgi:phospholipid/cholesterol/gamma-HCH transport system substrate-binding protein